MNDLISNTNLTGTATSKNTPSFYDANQQESAGFAQRHAEVDEMILFIESNIKKMFYCPHKTLLSSS